MALRFFDTKYGTAQYGALWRRSAVQCIWTHCAVPCRSVPDYVWKNL